MSMPVTAALQSPIVLFFFISARYSHSKKQQPTTDTAVTVSTYQPKLYTEKARAGTRAMRTSAMMWAVPSLVRIWGEEEPMRFNSL